MVLPVNDKDVTLQYQQSNSIRSGDTHTYVSADGSVLYTYYSDTKKPKELNVSNYNTSDISELSTEAEYVEWCRSVINEYCEADLNEYLYSCVTESKGGTDYDGFKDDLGENLGRYTFSFVRCFGEFVTSDEYVLTIYPPDNRLMIRFDEGKFENYGEINIDATELDRRVDEFLHQSLKYDFISYEILDRILVFDTEGVMAVSCTIKVEDGGYGFLTIVGVLFK